MARRTLVLRLIWRRNLYDWEQEDVSRLQTIIQQLNPDRDRDDKMIWRHSGSMIYPTKSIRVKMLEGETTMLPKPVINIVCKNVYPAKSTSVSMVGQSAETKNWRFSVGKRNHRGPKGNLPLLQHNYRIKLSYSSYMHLFMEVLDGNFEMVGYLCGSAESMLKVQYGVDGTHKKPKKQKVVGPSARLCYLVPMV